MRKTHKNELDITSAMSVNARARRREAGLSLFNLACRVGVTTQTLVNLEQGHTKRIKKHNFEHLADALGVDVDILSGDDRYVEPPIMLSYNVVKNIERLSVRAGFGDDIEGYLEWRFRK